MSSAEDATAAIEKFDGSVSITFVSHDCLIPSFPH